MLSYDSLNKTIIFLLREFRLFYLILFISYRIVVYCGNHLDFTAIYFNLHCYN